MAAVSKIKKFTLIELIIVVAIMSVLLSLLQPSLEKTISLAKAKECKNNLRQISSAIILYTDDESGNLPGPFWTAQTARVGRNNKTWKYRLNGFLTPYMNVKDAEGYQYIDAFTCPTVKDIYLKVDVPIIDRVSYYAPNWNANFGGRPFGRPPLTKIGAEEIAPAHIAEIFNPSQIMIMEDADFQNMPWRNPDEITFYPSHFQAYRNRNYFDGHVDEEDWYP